MFQSKYSFKIGDRDLALILVHVKYRTYTHFTILALLHIEDWMTDCKSMKITEEFAGMHRNAPESYGDSSWISVPSGVPRRVQPYGRTPSALEKLLCCWQEQPRSRRSYGERAP